MAANNVPNVWSQMDYVPPRGQCNFKQSIIAPKCPCLRFMLHPLKSSSSYECDGCGHHASFHSLENKVEDEIRKRWEQEARDKAEQQEAVAARPRKRLREIEYSKTTNMFAIENRMPTPDEMGDVSEAGGTRKTRGKGGKKGPGTVRATRAKGKVTEIPEEEEEEEVVELD